MTRSRDSVNISASTLEDAVSQLNFILQRFNDRLDKLEGLRDSFETEDGASIKGYARVYDEDDNLVHSMGQS